MRDALSLDYSVRPRQHVRRNGQADLFGGFEVDLQLKLCGLLDWWRRNAHDACTI